MRRGEETLARIRKATGYDPEGEGSVDNLIAYKDALEDRLLGLIPDDREPNVEELAVEILKAHDLPAELQNTGGGCMVAEVKGEHGVYAWVTETEIDNDGEPFSVGLYAQWEDEPELIRCTAAQLPDVVSSGLAELEKVAE
jgi:hypothetical protein